MNKEKVREKILQYLEAYNNFDIDSMLLLLSKNIVFKNIVNENVNVETSGLEEFRTLTSNSASIFKKRKQTMITIAVEDNLASVEIFFDGILAKDIPEVAQKDDEIRIEGYSEFEFDDQYYITKITDYSR